MRIAIITNSNKTFDFIVKQSCKHLQKDVRKNYKMVYSINDIRGKDFEKIGIAYDAYRIEDYNRIMEYIDFKNKKTEHINSDIFI